LVLSKKFKEEKNRELSTASAKAGRNADNRQTNRQSNLIRSTGGTQLLLLQMQLQLQPPATAVTSFLQINIAIIQKADFFQ
jgi:hypothetical protein